MTRITVAFASLDHARAALRFLARSSVVAGVSAIRGGSGAELAVVDVDARSADADRLRTLLAGAHGLIVAEATWEVPAIA